MNILKLQGPVTVTGLDVWGRESWIRFSPTRKPGWWWKRPDDVSVPINTTIADTAKSRLLLTSNGYSFNIIEHIIALRYTGLVGGVLVECKHFEDASASGCWPPTDGSAWIYWGAVEEEVTKTNDLVWWQHGKRAGFWQDPENGRAVFYDPTREQSLIIEANIDYPELPPYEVNFQLPDHNERLGYILKQKSPGMLQSGMSWEESAQFLRETDEMPFAGLRLDVMDWPEAGQETLATYRFGNHRVLDILGALALCGNNVLLGGKIDSVKGGHLGDLTVMKQILNLGEH